MNDKGFTLIELLVVILMVGVLSAIAVPAWLAFANNQRLNTASITITQDIKSAQSDAKRLRLLKEIPTSSVSDNITVQYPTPRLKFDYQGAVKGDVPYRINLSIGAKQYCVVTVTKLGVVMIGKDSQRCDQLSSNP